MPLTIAVFLWVAPPGRGLCGPLCRVADHAKVFVNGNWVGIVPDAEHIAQVIRGKRRQNLIEFEVSVYRDIPNQEVGPLGGVGGACVELWECGLPLLRHSPQPMATLKFYLRAAVCIQIWLCRVSR